MVLKINSMDEEREKWSYLIKWSCLGIAYNLYELFSLEFYFISQNILILSSQFKKRMLHRLFVFEKLSSIKCGSLNNQRDEISSKIQRTRIRGSRHQLRARLKSFLCLLGKVSKIEECESFFLPMKWWRYVLLILRQIFK